MIKFLKNSVPLSIPAAALLFIASMFTSLISASTAFVAPAMPDFSDLSCFESSRAANFYKSRIIDENRNPSITEEDRRDLLLKSWGIVSERCNNEFKDDSALIKTFSTLSCFEARRNAEDYSDPSISGISLARRILAGELATNRCYSEINESDLPEDEVAVLKSYYDLLANACHKLWGKPQATESYKIFNAFCKLDAAAATNQLIDPHID